MNSSDEDVAALVAAIGELPEPDKEPDGYRDGLALCVLDSIFSIGVKYKQVENLVDRYRSKRREDGSNADTDTANDLLKVIDSVGGSDKFADYVENHTRTSSTGGILKSEAVSLVAKMLVDSGLDDTEQLRQCAESERIEVIEARWCKVHGQSSGISWSYFLMLAGLDGVKADRMIISFCVRVLERAVTSQEASELVTASADHLGQLSKDVDYKIWSSERERS